MITVPDSIQLPTATVRVNTHAREHPHANSEIRKTFKTRGTVKVLGHVGPYWTAIVTSIEDASMDKVLYIRRSAILTQTAIPASGCADAVNELTVALAEANDTIDSVRRLVTP